MVERRDFVVPFFNNQYRFDKPPLTYWAQALSYQIFGENDFAARFPSAVAAALVAVALFCWGRTMDGNERTGWYAALIFTLSFQVVEHAKAAVADMWLVLFVTLAHWAGWKLIESRQSKIENPKSWWWIFYLSLALAFLAKGPIGWVPLLTVFVVSRFFTEGGPARRFKFVPGLILMLGVVCLWGIPALLRTHGEFFRIGIGRHVIGRSFGVIGGHGASSTGLYLLLLPFYFVTVFLTFFPWSIKLPALIARRWQRRDATDVYLITGSLIVFGIFTLVTTRLVHYTLPAFPLLALLMARLLVTEPVRQSGGPLPIVRQSGGPLPIVRQSGGPNSTRFFRNCVAVMIPVYLVCLLIFSPFAGVISPARQLASDARASLTPEMQFGAAEFQEPSLVWYFRKHVRSFMTPLHESDAKAFMSQDGGRFVVLPTALAQELWPSTPEDWKKYSEGGFNLAKLSLRPEWPWVKRIDLTLLIKEK